MQLRKTEKLGILAIKMLRKSRLNLGLPFMINSRFLPSDQCYLEYPNGDIKLATICRSNNDFKILSELTSQESYELRKKSKLA